MIEKETELKARDAAAKHVKVCQVFASKKSQDGKHIYPDDCEMCLVIELLGQYARHNKEIAPIIDAIKFVAR